MWANPLLGRTIFASHKIAEPSLWATALQREHPGGGRHKLPNPTFCYHQLTAAGVLCQSYNPVNVSPILPGAMIRKPGMLRCSAAFGSADLAGVPDTENKANTQPLSRTTGHHDDEITDSWDGDRYSWMVQNMPVTATLVDQLPDMSQVRLACCMHLDSKMAPAVFGLLDKGAAVFLTTCNPDTVDNLFVAEAVAKGATAVAWRGMTSEQWTESLKAALDWGPTHLCDMGAQLTVALAESQRSPDKPVGSCSGILAALEATGTGLNRLREMPELPAYPVFNWDDAPIKSLVHNKHMVGLTAMCALYNATQLSLHGKRVLVMGGGLVGQGVAKCARSFGALDVTVAEINPVRALAINFDGVKVASPSSGGKRWLEIALSKADVIVTATGARNVIGLHNVGAIKDKAILMNVGHGRDEIDVDAIRDTFESSLTLQHVRRIHVDPARLAGWYPLDVENASGDSTVMPHDIFLLCEGSMANLVAAPGDSLNSFDLLLAAMVAGIDYMCSERYAVGRPDSGLHVLPDDASAPVAEIQQRLLRKHDGSNQAWQERSQTCE